MSDLRSFETRFAAAIEHYAEQARVDVDPERITATARAADRGWSPWRVGPGGQPRADRWLIVLAAALLLVAALVAFAVSGAWRPRFVERPIQSPVVGVTDIAKVDGFVRVGPAGDGGWWGGTLLSDGTVLLIGGLDPDVTLTSGPTAIFDPKTGVLRASGPLTTPRYSATVTTLQDGRVLVAGGIGRSGVLASVEIFDPSTGTFSAAAPMRSPGAIASATLLRDGRVLVVGLDGGANELYDPPSDSWQLAGTTVARGYQTATRLTDGRVLVVGGWGGPDRVSAASEVFDPSTDEFAASGSLALRRNQHAAALLEDGRVLVVGGMTNPDGFTLDTVVASAEVYDPAKGSFEPAGDLQAARAGHDAVTLLDGRVVVIGGEDRAGDVLATELFDRALGSFSVGPPSHGHAIVVVPLPNDWVLDVTDEGIEVFVPAGAPRPTWAPPA